MSSCEDTPSTPRRFERVIDSRPGARVFDFAELYGYRDLIAFLVLRDIRVLYKQTVLGFGWAVVRPLLGMVLFTVVFGRIVRVGSDGVPYPLFCYVALVPWTFFQSGVIQATNSLVAGAQLLSKVYFPRLIMPMTPIVAALLDFFIALALTAFLLVGFRFVPSVNLWALPIPVAIMVTTTLGAGIWLSALAVQYRDVRVATQFIMQLLMYAAPVVWPISALPERFRLVYGLYPLTGVVEGFRSTILGTQSIPWDLFAVGSGSSLVLLLSGVWFFGKVERSMADVV